MGRHPNDELPSRATPPVAALEDRACADADPEIFYPRGNGHAQEAIEVCGRCPHREPCLEFALETGQGFGVWGGTTAEQRQAMTARRTA